MIEKKGKASNRGKNISKILVVSFITEAVSLFENIVFIEAEGKEDLANGPQCSFPSASNRLPCAGVRRVLSAGGTRSRSSKAMCDNAMNYQNVFFFFFAFLLLPFDFLSPSAIGQSVITFQ